MASKHQEGRLLNGAKDFSFFLVGSLIYAVSVTAFTAPNQIAPGGITGISTMLNYVWGLPIGTLSLVLNLPIFAWGIIEIGYKLVAKTIVATVLTSIAIDLSTLVLPAYHGDPMLAAIYGGILQGIGLSLVFMRGGTTGGTDMTARLLGKHFRHLSMGKLMMAIDLVVIVISAAVFNSIESALYAIITIFVSTKLIDAILYGTDAGTGKMLFIMSGKNPEIAQAILHEVKRGVTVLMSRGAYSGREGEVLLCAVRRYEVYIVKDVVQRVDEDAFIIVGDAGEISGEGFREVQQEDQSLKDLIKKRNQKKKK